MEFSHIAVRAVFGYVCALVLVRITGRRTVREANAASFVLAVIMGDLFDDLFWAEVSAAQFVTAISTLTLCHVSSTLAQMGAGRRKWRRQAAGVVR